MPIFKGRSPISPAPQDNESRFLSGRVAIAGALASLFCASAFLLPARGADSSAAIPQLMLPWDQGWSGFIARDTDPNIYLPDDYLHGRASIERAQAFGVPADKVSAYLTARAF